MLVQQVDVIGIHAGKRLLNHGTDAFGAAVQAVGDDAVFKTEFGGPDLTIAASQTETPVRSGLGYR